MYIRVDVEGRSASLEEPENFTQFHVAAAGGDSGEVADALGSDGRQAAAADHVWIDVAAVRRMARGHVIQKA